jgi:hypothetical protein
MAASLAARPLLDQAEQRDDWHRGEIISVEVRQATSRLAALCVAGMFFEPLRQFLVARSIFAHLPNRFVTVHANS